jgi:elongation factor G
MLFYSGATRSIGNVDDGNTHTDFMEEERERGITIQAAATSFSWKSFPFSLIDTPGHVDFSMEVVRSVRVLDGVVAVIDAVKGVEAQTIANWRQVEKHGVPAVIFMNKMDRDGASFERSQKTLKDELKLVTLPLQVPVGAGREFAEVLDLVAMTTLSWDTTGSKMASVPLCPKEGKAAWDAACAARNVLLEDLAMLDDTLAEVRGRLRGD